MAGRKIHFEFVGDTSQLEAGIDKLGSSTDELGGKFKDTFEKDGVGGLKGVLAGAGMVSTAVGVATIAVAAMGAALVTAVKGAIELGLAADKIAKTSKQVGASAEEFQILSGALDMGGVDAATAEAAIAKLNLRLAEAAAGGGPAVDVLKQLGLNAKELQELPLPERFAVLADRMDHLGTVGEKTNAAVKLMEEGGIRLLSAFEGGGDAIRASADQIKAAGVISNDTAAQGEGLADAIAIATRQFEMMKNDGLAPLIPIIAMTTEMMGELFQWFGNTGVLEAMATAVAFVAEKFLGLTDEVERFKQETKEMNLEAEQTSKRLEFWKGHVEELTGVIDPLIAEQKRLKDDMRLMPWRDSAKQVKRLKEIEEELIRPRKELRWATRELKDEEESLADARDEATTAAKAAKDAAEAEAAAAEAAANKEADRASRRAGYAAAAKANQDKATALLDQWQKKVEDAELAQLEGMARLLEAEKRAKQETLDLAGNVAGEAGVQQAQVVAILEAAQAQILMIEQDYAAQRIELEKETKKAKEDLEKAEVEAHQAALEEKHNAEFEYYEAVAEQAAYNKERNTEMRQEDVDEFRDVSNAIGSIALAALDAIGQATQAAYDEKAAAYNETADRIEEIDTLLQGELSKSERRRLEQEKANLEEQAAAEKEAALDAWRANKAIAITSAIISTALAIINGLTTMPFPAGVVAAVVAGVAGAASIVAIAAEQPPQLHSGGMIPDLQAAAAASDEITIRARRGEAVLSPAGVAAAGGAPGVADLNAGAETGRGQTVNLIRVGPRTTEAIMHDTLRVRSSNLSRAISGVRPRVGRHDPRVREG